MTSNKSVAPKTFLLLDNLDTFMKGTIFGNAFFSVLEPHSSIPSHCGPTNLRVRCHLGIQVKYACDPGWSTIPGHKLALERMGFLHWINLQRSIQFGLPSIQFLACLTNYPESRTLYRFTFRSRLVTAV